MFYRLGVTIENHAWIKNYHAKPPRDFAKWARICEHIVRHYNEGWADGFKWNIKYWEIWNEPDGNKPTADGRPGPTWTGTNAQFLNFDTIEHYKDFGGIRIEDDVLVTKDGCRFLGKERIPYHIADVEAFLAAREG